MENLKLRCPACDKLYSVETELIQSSCPQFQCHVCDSRFEFDYPSVSIAEILPTRRVLSADGKRHSTDHSLAVPMANNLSPDGDKNCPKCGKLNKNSYDECVSCHVIFSKLEGLPADSSLGAQPRLVALWKSLLEDFENTSLHEGFILACQQSGAIRFAIFKYEEIKKLQGQDPLCDLMLNKIKGLSLLQMQQPSDFASLDLRYDLAGQFLREQLLPWSPYIFSAILILIGVVSPHLRNLIGFGVSFALLVGGLKIFFKGKSI
ncbi:MAG: hypothetical protein ACOYOK_12655 [Pseudobdellovibrionaceae bacterium]